MNTYSQQKSNITINNIYKLGGIFSTIIFVFLIHRSLPLDRKAHQKYQNAIATYKEKLFELNREIIKSNYIRTDLGEQITAYLKELTELRSQLADIPDFILPKGQEELEAVINNYQTTTKKRNRLIEQFKEGQGILNDSCSSISVLRNELGKDSNDAQAVFTKNEQLFVSINDLFQILIIYCLERDEYLKPIIQSKNKIISELTKQVELDSDKIKIIIAQLVEQSKIILDYKTKTQEVYQQVLDFTNLNEITKIEEIYLTQYQNSVARVNFYRILTYILFLSILIFIAYQIIRGLTKDNRNIVAVLENFTAELESQVEQRTAQLEESIKKTETALDRAQNANEAKSRFLANMSHELRTPLNAILGFTQLMCRDPSIASEHQENLRIINRSGEHLLKLINDILEMSKIEVGQIVINENTFNIYSMLKSLEDMLRLKAESKNLKLIFDIDNNLPKYIKTDEGKLRQIVINLLGNALKFTERGSVILRAKLKNLEESEDSQFNFLLADIRSLHFEIEDTGPGIEMDEINQLFTPFEQTKIGLQSKEGTGLGLSISQKFVELMGGKLTVKSVVGKGTIFEFDILAKSIEPNSLENNLDSEERTIVGLAADTKQYRILAVDDVEASRLLLRKMLTSLGFEVKEASNGREAIDIWQSWYPNLILMDMRMPVMDGYEATKRIKSQPAGEKTTIIALTASAFEEERLVILAAGCDDFMRKPFQEQELLQKIGQHLGIDYIYEENQNIQLNQSLLSPAEIAQQLTKESLEVMSLKWRSQLHQAAAQVDNQKILELIAEIPEEYSSLGEQLSILVKQFRCDKIIALTESVNQ